MLYRGYYYDSELAMYYLQSRYYNPTMQRFFNADDPIYAKENKDEPVGTNLFAYCNNDPVNNSDPSGYLSEKLVQGILGGVLGALMQYLADLINVKCFRGEWSKFSVYIVSALSGIWDAVTNSGYFKSLAIAVGKNVIGQIINKINSKTDFSMLAVVIAVFDFSVTYLINKKLKIKSPSKIKDIKKKAKALGIKGTKKLIAYLNKQIFKISLANITLSNIKVLLKKTINNGLKNLFGKKPYLIA